MEPKIEVTILEETDNHSLKKAAQEALDNGWRPIGGPYSTGTGFIGWAFIKVPPPPEKPPQPEPTREELIKAAAEGRTIRREE